MNKVVGMSGNPYSGEASFDSGGEPPDNGLMEARVAKLEEFAGETRDRLARIETKLDSTATKADLVEAINGQIKWMIGTALVLGAAAITIITFVLNNATPKTAAVVQPPAIVINVPASGAAPPIPSASTARP